MTHQLFNFASLNKQPAAATVCQWAEKIQHCCVIANGDVFSVK